MNEEEEEEEEEEVNGPGGGGTGPWSGEEAGRFSAMEEVELMASALPTPAPLAEVEIGGAVAIVGVALTEDARLQ